MFDDLTGKKTKPKKNLSGTTTTLIKAWAIKHWRLPGDTTLLVSELQCGEAGCADIETVIAILTVEDTDKTVKLNKPIYSVQESDIKSINIWRNPED